MSQKLIEIAEKYPQYYKHCPYEYVDVYRVLSLFQVTDPCIQHAAKKLLLSGVRTGNKPAIQDIKEAIDTLNRYLIMEEETDAVIKSGIASKMEIGPQRSGVSPPERLDTITELDVDSG